MLTFSYIVVSNHKPWHVDFLVSSGVERRSMHRFFGVRSSLVCSIDLTSIPEAYLQVLDRVYKVIHCYKPRRNAKGYLKSHPPIRNHARINPSQWHHAAPMSSTTQFGWTTYMALPSCRPSPASSARPSPLIMRSVFVCEMNVSKPSNRLM